MTTQTELIGKFINRYGYTDINPVGKIIGLVGKCSVLVKRVEATEQTTKMEFLPGGFSAICVNQYSQNWTMQETEETFTVRLSKQYLKTCRIDDKPVKFYDYNF